MHPSAHGRQEHGVIGSEVRLHCMDRKETEPCPVGGGVLFLFGRFDSSLVATQPMGTGPVFLRREGIRMESAWYFGFF